MVPEFPGLRPLTLDDHALLVRELAGVSSPICDLSPANLLIWRDCELTSATRVGDSLCLLVEPHSEPGYFLEPVGGTRRVEAARVCLSRAGRISRATRSLVELISPLEFDVRPLRDHFDYVYEPRTLSELKGKKFDGKRNQIRRFIRTCPDYEFRPLEGSDFGRVMTLFERWSERHDRVTAPQVSPPASLNPDCQRRALERALQGFGRLGLIGGGLRVRGELQAFVIASPAPRAGAVVHFQYANTEIPGIYQTLLREACRRLFAACAWINLEEDVGVPGLRRTKLSYQPLRFEEKFEIRLAAVTLSGPASRPGESPQPDSSG